MWKRDKIQKMPWTLKFVVSPKFLDLPFLLGGFALTLNS